MGDFVPSADTLQTVDLDAALNRVDCDAEEALVDSGAGVCCTAVAALGEDLDGNSLVQETYLTYTAFNTGSKRFDGHAVADVYLRDDHRRVLGLVSRRPLYMVFPQED